MATDGLTGWATMGDAENMSEDSGSGRTVRYIGGPHDGMTWENADPPPDGGPEADGARMTVAGTDQRALYEPQTGEDPDVWHYRGMVP